MQIHVMPRILTDHTFEPHFKTLVVILGLCSFVQHDVSPVVTAPDDQGSALELVHKVLNRFRNY